LDVAIFQSLKWNYDKEVNGWLKKHPGRIVTEAEIAERFQNAYSRAATVGNAASAFSKTGIHPFNADIFCDDDFIAADVTDIPMEPDVDGTVGSSDAIPSTSSSASTDVVAIKSPDGLISGILSSVTWHLLMLRSAVRCRLEKEVCHYLNASPEVTSFR